MKKPEVTPTTESSNYSLQWHINMVINDIENTIGKWALHLDSNRDGTIVTLENLQCLRSTIDAQISEAMEDAYHHIHRVRGYHFYEEDK